VSSREEGGEKSRDHVEERGEGEGSKVIHLIGERGGRRNGTFVREKKEERKKSTTLVLEGGGEKLGPLLVRAPE